MSGTGMSGTGWTSFNTRKRKQSRRTGKKVVKMVLILLFAVLVYKVVVWMAALMAPQEDVSSQGVSFTRNDPVETATELCLSFLGREMPGISPAMPPEFTFTHMAQKAAGSLLGVDWSEPLTFLAVDVAGLPQSPVSTGLSPDREITTSGEENWTHEESGEGESYSSVEGELPEKNDGEDSQREELEYEDLDGDDPEEKLTEEFSEGMEIFIYHSHITETFVPDAGEPFTENMDVNMAHLGAMLARELEEEYGITVRHHKEIFDIPRRYAYREARPVIRNIIEENPEIGLVVDLHRDGIARQVTTAEINGRAKGKVLFVIGSNHEEWYYNHSVARIMEQELEEYEPALSRGIREKPYVYNQDLHPCSVLVEVGGHENSLEEAERTIPFLAEILARTYRSLMEGE